MPNTPYPIDPVLSAIAVGYRNPVVTYIADQVLPRSSVMREEFKWWKFPLEETFRLPDARVGRRGKVNEVLLTATEQTSSTDDYGLDDVIPWPDTAQAQVGAVPPGFDPVGQATMQLTDYIMLGREKRVADLVFDADQYPSGFKVQLTTTDQWDEYAEADSNPIEDILTGIDAMLMPATHMVIGSAAWLKLRAHPRIVQAIHGNEGDQGIATRQQVAELFELPGGVLVGEGRLNTAAYGQPAVLGRVWGPHALLAHINPNASLQSQSITLGLTAEFGPRVAGQQTDDRAVGLRGGTRVRVGESVKELIVAAQAAYFIEDAV